MTVTGVQPPGALDFQHTIPIRQLRATVDVHIHVHIHYSIEEADAVTRVSRWLVLDIHMPFALRPLRPAITRTFDIENVRTMEALKTYAESHPAADRHA